MRYARIPAVNDQIKVNGNYVIPPVMGIHRIAA